jgi:NitT/TauT family transport system permease protein
MLRRGELLPHLGASLLRESVGLALSIVAGMLIGIAMAVSRRTERVLQPFITFLYPLPKSALIPIIIIWFGLGHGAQIAVIFLGCLLPIVLSSFNGARGVDTVMVWSARSLGASPRKAIRDVVIRAAMPEILAGIRVALALSFVLLVSAEMVGARQGMGYLISFLGEAGEYAGMFAAIFTVVAFGFAADRLYLLLMKRALRWREA